REIEPEAFPTRSPAGASCARCHYWQVPSERETSDYEAFQRGVIKRRVKDPLDRVIAYCATNGAVLLVAVALGGPFVSTSSRTSGRSPWRTAAASSRYMRKDASFGREQKATSRPGTGKPSLIYD